MRWHILTETGEIAHTLDMRRAHGDVWCATGRRLHPGDRYAISVSGPEGAGHRFDADQLLLDPYGRGVDRLADGTVVSVVVDDSFDWGDIEKPRTPLAEQVVYEMHVRGFTELSEFIAPEVRGTYAGLASAGAIEYLQRLGVTTVQLLPVHAFRSEKRLESLGLTNYWGYNTVSFFAPHPEYASRAARAEGASAVLREFKGMVRNLHEAGIEVWLDVVYNHTGEEGPDGPTSSFRGIDNASYYRVDEAGEYIDVTGCGNSLDTSVTQVADLVLDSLAYWANEVQIDGFRFDLAAELGRDENVEFRADAPLLREIASGERLDGATTVAEPWDLGIHGWQTGHFPVGWSEWNNSFRDRVREFWVRDAESLRAGGTAASAIGAIASRFAGSSDMFSAERGPLASVNLITAHDGFTMRDLVSYNVKHNMLNGENNRDGTDNNLSFNFGVEGQTDDPAIRGERMRVMRNLFATLLFSSGVPMITAGDEFGRTQQGNNNAYCQDSPISWLDWQREPWQDELWHSVRALIALRHANPALRPAEYARDGEVVSGATEMRWFNALGEPFGIDDWHNPHSRTLQYYAEAGDNRVLVVIHGTPDQARLVLASPDSVTGFALLWDSARTSDAPATRIQQAPLDNEVARPGDAVVIDGLSVRLYAATTDTGAAPEK